MDSVPVFASASEAMDMVYAGLRGQGSVHISSDQAGLFRVTRR